MIKILHALLIVLLFHSPTALGEIDPALKKKGLRALFAEGFKLFNEKKYKKSEEILKYVVNKYPANEPAHTLLARISFLNKDYPKAYTHFKKIDTQYLDPSTRFEYAITLMNIKQNKQALDQFQLIPKKHPKFDIANFYAGKIAMQIDDYPLAKKHFTQAVVLPDKFVKNKELYLAHVEKVLHIRRLKRFKAIENREKSRKVSKQNIITKSNDEKRARKGQEKPEDKEAPARSYSDDTPLAHEPDLNNEESQLKIYEQHRFVGVFQQNTYQKSEFKSGKVQEFELSSTGFQFKDLPAYHKPIGDGERWLKIGALISASGEQRVWSGSQERIYLFENEEDFVQYYSKEQGEEQEGGQKETRDQVGRLVLEPLVEVPVYGSYTLGAKLHYSGFFPDFDKRRQISTRGVEATLKGWVNKNSFHLTGGFYEHVDSDGKLMIDKITSEVGLENSAVHEQFLIDISLGNVSYKYFSVALDGPDNLFSGKIGARWLLPLNIYLGGQAAYIMQTNYLFIDRENKKNIYADSQSSFGKIFLKGYLFEFISLSVEQQIYSHIYEIGSENRADIDTFNDNVHDYNSQLVFKGGLDLLF